MEIFEKKKFKISAIFVFFFLPIASRVQCFFFHVEDAAGGNSKKKIIINKEKWGFLPNNYEFLLKNNEDFYGFFFQFKKMGGPFFPGQQPFQGGFSLVIKFFKIIYSSPSY